MIFGRPTNLWLALVGAALGLTQVLIVTLVPDVDATAVATILGSFGTLLGVVIALVANQPPAVNDGGQVTVVTPTGQPNAQVLLHANGAGIVATPVPPDPGG